MAEHTRSFGEPMSYNQDVMYLDMNGNYGNAVGMILIDVKAMSPEVRERWEDALDGPNHLREFFNNMGEEGLIPSKGYLVEGTGIILSQQALDQAGPMLRRAGYQGA